MEGPGSATKKLTQSIPRHFSDKRSYFEKQEFKQPSSAKPIEIFYSFFSGFSRLIYFQMTEK